jgi:transposase
MRPIAWRANPDVETTDRSDLPDFFGPVISGKMALLSERRAVRKSRFSDEQMVAILREAERTSVAEAAKKNKVSEQTIYTWRKHFNGLAPNDVKRLKTLESENAKLKKLLAERDLELEVMREVNRKKW